MKLRHDSCPQTRSSLEDALSAITQQFGDGTVRRLGGTPPPIATLSTGCLAADLALGVGGLPKGRIIEVFGPESSGKTSLCLATIAEAQRRGGTAALIDVEHSLDPKWAHTCGVAVDQLLVSQPDCGEDALTVAEILIKSGSVDLLVIDSVAALVPKSELEGQMGDATVGAQARLMSQAMRRLTAAVAHSGTVCIFTNQIREKIGVLYGSPEYQPGGRALKFFASVRLDLRRKDALKSPDGRVTGNRVKLRVVKNKVAAPFAECEFDLDYTEGVSNSGTLLDLGLAHGLLEKKGAWISRRGELLAQGREAAKQHLRDHPAVALELADELRRLLVPTFLPAAA